MGLRDGFPVGLGYIAVSFAFGIVAKTSGLTIYEAFLISLTNLTSAGQLAAVPIITAGGSLIELAMTQFVINSRYLLMSVSLSQKFDKNVRLRDRFLLAFANTDELFAVAIGKGQPLGRAYLYTLIIYPYIGWSLGTLLGAIAGSILPEVFLNALGIALYAMFVAILVPASKQSRGTGLCIAVSALASCAFYFLPKLKDIPSGFVIMILSLCISLLFALIAPIKEGEDDV
ncbi:MAG: AzlC family ABC transporter permease [Clostridia bacterium]|nr:AzlC family ABC transporter permease [Clostridia bacterium]